MSLILRTENLGITLPRGSDPALPVLENLNLRIEEGEFLALVGESGSGKSIAALAIMRLLPRAARLSGRVMLADQNLADLPERALKNIRGRDIGMVFQNPLAALNPSRTIGAQIIEARRVHFAESRAVSRAHALALLEEVGIENAAGRLDDYPHQFSGGMRQRAMLAIALACGPKLLIADEPTTGLDPGLARQIMELIARLRRERGMAVLFVTHDLSLVERHADRMFVLYAGRFAESGRRATFFAGPRHPYSEALLAAIPRLGQARLRAIPGAMPEPGARPDTCLFRARCAYAEPDCAGPAPARNAGATLAACRHPLAKPFSRHVENAAACAPPERPAPLLTLRDVSVTYARPGFFAPRRAALPALAGISLELGRGECLGIVGESGSGKSTLGRAILQMLAYDGEMVLDGQSLPGLRGAARRQARRRIGIVFQDPRDSLNPRLRIADIVAEPLRLEGVAAAARRAAAAEFLRRVGLDPALGPLFPAALSGGQAQRVAIARALAGQPDLIVLDEPTSALDVSTQAMLLNLLKDLAGRQKLSYLLISHDIAAVSFLAARILVLRGGRAVEYAETARLLAAPASAYTAGLLAAAKGQ